MSNATRQQPTVCRYFSKESETSPLPDLSTAGTEIFSATQGSHPLEWCADNHSRQDNVRIYRVWDSEYGGGDSFGDVQYVLIEDHLDSDAAGVSDSVPLTDHPDCTVYTYSPADETILARYDLPSNDPKGTPEYYIRDAYKNAQCRILKRSQPDLQPGHGFPSHMILTTDRDMEPKVYVVMDCSEPFETWMGDLQDGSSCPQLSGNMMSQADTNSSGPSQPLGAVIFRRNRRQGLSAFFPLDVAESGTRTTSHSSHPEVASKGPTLRPR